MAPFKTGARNFAVQAFAEFLQNQDLQEAESCRKRPHGQVTSPRPLSIRGDGGLPAFGKVARGSQLMGLARSDSFCTIRAP